MQKSFEYIYIPVFALSIEIHKTKKKSCILNATPQKEKLNAIKTVHDISSTTESLSNIVTMEHVNIHGSSSERFQKTPKKTEEWFFARELFMVIFTDVHHTFNSNYTPSVKASHSPFT